MKFEKSAYGLSVSDGKFFYCEVVTGYIFSIPNAKGDHRFATHKDEKGNWELTDYLTGKSCTSLMFKTRKEVVEYAKRVVIKFESYDSVLYQVLTELFEKILRDGRLSIKDYEKLKENRLRELRMRF